MLNVTASLATQFSLSHGDLEEARESATEDVWGRKEVRTVKICESAISSAHHNPCAIFWFFSDTETQCGASHWDAWRGAVLECYMRLAVQETLRKWKESKSTTKPVNWVNSERECALPFPLVFPTLWLRSCGSGEGLRPSSSQGTPLAAFLFSFVTVRIWDFWIFLHFFTDVFSLRNVSFRMLTLWSLSEFMRRTLLFECKLLGTMRGRVRVTEDPGGVKGLIRAQAGPSSKQWGNRGIENLWES